MNKYLPALRTLISDLTESEENVRNSLKNLKAQSSDLEKKKVIFNAHLISLRAYATFISDTDLVQQWLEDLEKTKNELQGFKDRSSYMAPDYLGMENDPAAQNNLALKTASNISVDELISRSLEELDKYFKETQERIPKLSKILNDQWITLLQQTWK